MSLEQDPLTSLSVQLPESLCKKLFLHAESRTCTFDEHIQSILENYLVGAGFCGQTLTSLSGRNFQIVHIEDDIPDQRDCVVATFYLKELRFNKNRAYYIIGLDQELVEDWAIRKTQESVKQVGLALLNFYNREIEIDEISWPHTKHDESFDGFRVLSWKDVAPAKSLNEFLDLLRANEWKDSIVKCSGKSQDFRRGRNPSDLYK